jgi:uncharacterized membrane protein (GlpM family)
MYNTNGLSLHFMHLL